MSLPATDTFTGSDGTALQTYNANWAINGGALRLRSNGVEGSFGGEDLARWTADTFGNDQYSQGVLAGTNNADHAPGVGVRIASSGVTRYGFYTGQWGREATKYVTGSYTSLAFDSTKLSPGDVIRLEASGTTITPKVNGATDAVLGASTDSTLTSGSAGLAFYGSGVSGGFQLDNWEGGNLGGAAVTSSPPSRRGRLWRRKL